MRTSLPPELANRVKNKVESGLYNNTSEIIREALCFMDTHDDWVQELKLAALRKELSVGIEQLDNGQGITVAGESALDQFFDDVKARASRQA